MLGNIRHLYQFRDLLFTWTSREIKVRYKQSVVGGLWAILQPLALMVIFTIVFGYFVQVPTGDIPYPIFSYSALLPWTFLATSISFAVPSLVTNMNLVTKIYFPREILPLASVAAAFFDLLIASILFLIMMLFYRLPPTLAWIWLPLLLFIQTLLILGVVFFMSTLNVYFRDIRFLIPLGLQIWMYASPIIYPLDLVPEQLRTLYMLNPMAGLIESYRRVLLAGQPPVWQNLLISAVISTLLFVGGYSYFKRSEKNFADVI